MEVRLTLSNAELTALQRLASMMGGDIELAAHLALREFLVGAGLLDLPPEIDEDTETVGEA